MLLSPLGLIVVIHNGLSSKIINMLHLIQNSALRLIALSKRSDPITQIFASLHELPVNYRIDLEVWSAYLSDLSIPSEPDCILKSFFRTHSSSRHMGDLQH